MMLMRWLGCLGVLGAALPAGAWIPRIQAGWLMGTAPQAPGARSAPGAAPRRRSPASPSRPLPPRSLTIEYEWYLETLETPRPQGAPPWRLERGAPCEAPPRPRRWEGNAAVIFPFPLPRRIWEKRDGEAGSLQAVFTVTTGAFR